MSLPFVFAVGPSPCNWPSIKCTQCTCQENCNHPHIVIIKGQVTCKIEQRSRHGTHKCAKLSSHRATRKAHIPLKPRACWLPNASEIDKNITKYTWPMQAPTQGDPTRPIIIPPACVGVLLDVQVVALGV